MIDVDQKQQRYDEFVRRAEIPMLVLAIFFVPVVLMPLIEDLSPASEQALRYLGIAVWVAFVIEYVLLIGLSPNRRRTIVTHKLELALVLLPFLRPLRLVRLTRLAQAGTAIGRAGVIIRRVAGRPGFATIIGTVAALIVGGGGLVTIAEHQQPGSTIENLGDGIWWALVTCTTVGYGDEFPVTTTGRIVAAVLMLAGISALSVLTANIAAYFVANDVEDEVDEVGERLARIEGQLQELIDANMKLG